MGEKPVWKVVNSVFKRLVFEIPGTLWVSGISILSRLIREQEKELELGQTVPGTQ